MNIKRNLTILCSLGFSSLAFGAPVEIDTPDAHIIVIRTFDSWSGDKGTSSDILDMVQARKTAFSLETPKGQIQGHPTLFGGLSENELLKDVVENLHKNGFELTKRVEHRINVGAATALSPTEYNLFCNKQYEIFNRIVIAQGNPSKLQGRVTTNKIFGSILSLGAIVVAGAKYGSLGSQTVINTGISNDVYEFSSASKAAFSPVNLPSFDPSIYKEIDVRKVVQNDFYGQVIIAYKNDKTEGSENAALVQSLVSLTGSDTNLEAIKQSKIEDLEHRQAIWDACVSEGKCKKD